MAQVDEQLSTGLGGLDKLLKGLIPGDNIVWQVDSIQDFLPFAEPYCRNTLQSGQRLVYFRFAKHAALANGESGAEVYHLHPEGGFEQFITEVHRVIRSVGRGGYYLFDCLSDLAVDWYSDQMLGNFFVLTCPYLYDVEAIAYFPLLRNYHSFYATSPIAETTQVLLDVLRYKGRLHIYPIKVQQRYSPTMFMLHAWEGDDFVPVRQSAMTSEILRSSPWQGRESSSYRQDVWNRTFLQAEETLAAVNLGESAPEKAEEYFQRLLRMAVSRQEQILALAEQYLSLSDVLAIGRRMVGTGLIGGKAVGMLLARCMVEQAEPRWQELFEPHDSFYIGSDVFYTFLVSNGVWGVRQRQRDLAAVMEGALTARRRILVGNFPASIEGQFSDMLDYFGQSPIIVRSSSLLEDSYGNAFAGKYESVFCVNQGPRQKRLDDFLSAVRTIYASTMSEKALLYRAQRGMLEQDEQMALLVQRVSGAMHKDLFFPQLAGVGLSFNPYVWSKEIDAQAGVVRLVFALGTRAVERHDDDYTRVVSLNAPLRRPEADFGQASQYSQKRVDVLDLQANQLVSKRFSEVGRLADDLAIEMFASRDEGAAQRADELGIKDSFPYVLTFKKLLRQTQLVSDMREMLAILQSAYGTAVETEFTANFLGKSAYKINLLQCRPFQCKVGGSAPEAPARLDAKDILLESRGAVIGQSREIEIDRFIYISPSLYSQLVMGERYQIAHLIGQIAHRNQVDVPKTVMLLGPGRWGTSTPSLGVPIRFSQISSVSVLCEIVAMREGVVPEVSLGTHIFNEMVEMNMVYLALFPSREGNFINEDFFESANNSLTELLPEQEKWAEVVRVIDACTLSPKTVRLYADNVEQRVVCYLKHSGV